MHSPGTHMSEYASSVLFFYYCYFCVSFAPSAFGLLASMSWMQTAICLISKDLMICFVLFCFVSDASGLRDRKHFSRDASVCFAPRLENYINPPLRWLQVLSFFLSLHHSHQLHIRFRFPFNTFAFSLSSLFFETEIFLINLLQASFFVVVIR